MYEIYAYCIADGNVNKLIKEVFVCASDKELKELRQKLAKENKTQVKFVFLYYKDLRKIN